MSTKIDIISGFLGAGKTTFIKKLIEKDYKNERLAIIENEFGQVGIDGEIFKSMDIDIREINSGCICCSLSGDFKSEISIIKKAYNPSRIIIEPSGVAKLSDIIKTCREMEGLEDVKLTGIITLVDSKNADLYLSNFGEFYKDQIRNAKVIIITKIEGSKEATVNSLLDKIKKLNPVAKIITDRVETINIMDVIEEVNAVKRVLNISINNNNSKLSTTAIPTKKKENHRADEVFSTWGTEVEFVYSERDIKTILTNIALGKNLGTILRAKGVVKSHRGEYLEFNYVPDKFQIDKINYEGIGKVSVIGKDIDKEKLKSLFMK